MILDTKSAHKENFDYTKTKSDFTASEYQQISIKPNLMAAQSKSYSSDNEGTYICS